MSDIPRHLLRFETAVLPQVFTDVLVVGSGIAGHAAAIESARAGARTLLVTKDGPLESNTYYAQGGIAVAVGEGDTAAAHVADTLTAGDGLCHPSVVRRVVGEAQDGLELLVDVGVDFDRDERGRLVLGREGGHSQRRIAHAHGDATGRDIQRALGQAVASAENARLVCDTFVVDLLTVDGVCVGALAFVGDELRVLWARTTVLATGGAGRLFRESTNPAVCTGDGLAMAYRAGAELRDMEFMQFHPTVLYVPGTARKLLSEAARGEGAVVRDARGERFLARYDERAELAPRDVVSRSMVSHMLQHGDTHVLLDLTGIDAERMARRLPGIVATGREIGIDVSREALPVRPAAHYTVGGIVADLDGVTHVPGLLAAGEVASTGLHGANRLASNSLLEGVVVGRRAGRRAAALAAVGTPQAYSLSSGGPGLARRDVDSDDLVRSIESLLWRQAGVQRDGPGLEVARQQLEAWAPLVLQREMPTNAGMEGQNLCTLAALLVDAAQRRRETRGVHWRIDHPARDDSAFRGHFVLRRGAPPSYVPSPEPA